MCPPTNCDAVMMHGRFPIRRGVTLIEILVVITIVGILSITVLPSFGRTDQARRAAGVAEVQRLFAYARDRAIASGQPVGVRLRLDDQQVELVTVDAAGVVSSLFTPLGQATEPVRVRDRFGLSVQDVEVPVASGAGADPDSPTIWFDHRGRPHVRGPSGGDVVDVSDEARVGFTDQSRVIVTPRTGMVRIERP